MTDEITIARVGHRYASAEQMAHAAVELVRVHDQVGSALNDVCRELARLQDRDGDDLWGDMTSAVRQLRWRTVLEPIPGAIHPELQSLIEKIKSMAEQMRSRVDDLSARVLADASRAAGAALASDPIIGSVLTQSVLEAGAESSVVFVLSARAQVAVRRWFEQLRIVSPVVAAGRMPLQAQFEQGYAVGPPRFFPPSLLTSPVVTSLSFLAPAWDPYTSLPSSPLAPFLEGRIQPSVRIFFEGVEPHTPEPIAPPGEDDLLPIPQWRTPSDSAVSAAGQIPARRLLLGGGLGMYLDIDGEHIRTLDPSQPSGARVAFTSAAAVGVGTYLVTREGTTEREVMYARAIESLGGKGQQVRTSQQKWKDELAKRLKALGRSEVGRDLRILGVRRYDRTFSWVDETVARPQDENDFAILLDWLGISRTPTIEMANSLQRARRKVSAEVREALENSLSLAGLTVLEETGILRLDLPIPGFRGIIATRVLAISPENYLVSETEIRVPQVDRRSQWLE